MISYMTGTSDRRALCVLLLVWIGMVGAGAAQTPPPAGKSRLEEKKSARAEARGESAGTGDASPRGSLLAGASVKFSFKGDQCRARPWLMLDTYMPQPDACSLTINLEGIGDPQTIVAHVQPGQDTLAVPLTVFLRQPASDWSGVELSVQITNSDSSAILYENPRLEAAPASPRDTVMVDFGPVGQAVWPGFRDGNPQSDAASIAGGSFTTVRMNFPDPLCGDGLAAPASSAITVNVPGSGTGVAWLWIGHAAGAIRGVPMEYMARVDGKPVAYKRLTPQQIFGSEGFFQGMGGEWTSRWFDKIYTPQHCDLVPTNLAGNRARIDLTNCYLAAMVIGPSTQAGEISQYVDRVKSDLSRFRRQFVMGWKQEYYGEMQPTEPERKAGFMVFRVAEDNAFLPGREPELREHATALRAICANGQTVTIPLALCPLQKTAGISGSLTGFRDAQGGAMLTPLAEVAFFQKIPWVRAGEVSFLPWIAAKKLAVAEERQYQAMFVTIPIPPTARTGVYTGAIRLAGSGTLDIPLQLEVVNIGPPAEPPTIGTMGETLGTRLFGGLAESQPEPQQEAITIKTRRDLLAGPINAFFLPGPDLNPKNDENFSTMLRGVFGGMKSPGLNLVSLHSAMASLADRRVIHYRTLGALVTKMDSMASQAGMNYTIYLGRLSADTISASGELGKGARCCVAAGVEDLSEGRFKGQLNNITSLILTPNSPGIEKAVERIKHLKKPFYLYTYPDRFATGFYAAALGASGCYVDEIFPAGSIYSGFADIGNVLVVPQSDWGQTLTLGAYRVKQGADDFMLLTRAMRLHDKARAAGADANELSAVLDKIREQCLRIEGLDYLRRLWRVENVPPSELEKWRIDLIRAAGSAAAKVK